MKEFLLLLGGDILLMALFLWFFKFIRDCDDDIADMTVEEQDRKLIAYQEETEERINAAERDSSFVTIPKPLIH